MASRSPRIGGAEGLPSAPSCARRGQPTPSIGRCMCHSALSVVEYRAPPFGERMLASILGQGDLMYPPPMGSSDPEHPHLGTARELIGKVYAGGGELVFREVAFGNVG